MFLSTAKTNFVKILVLKAFYFLGEYVNVT